MTRSAISSRSQNAASQRYPSSLGREILKWIQTLDLSYSVKNVRRDFSNGFLIAEMISRYHLHEINMHSFSNGISEPVRKDNWKLLKKYFNKFHVPITDQMIHDVIDFKSGAAIPIIHVLYKHLTDREVVVAKPPINTLPSLSPQDAQKSISSSNMTQSNMLQSNMMQSNMLQSNMSQSNTSMTTQHAVDPLLNSRPQNSLQPSSSSNLTRTIPPASSQRPTSNSSTSGAPVLFQDVHIKNLDKHQTRSRLQKSIRSTNQTPQTPIQSQNSLMKPLPSQETKTHQMDRSIDASINEKLNSIVEQTLGKSDSLLSNLDQRKDFIVSFIESVDTIPLEYSSEIFKSFNEMLPLHADNFLFNPREFWKFSALFVDGLKIPVSSPNFIEFVNVFCTVGSSMLVKDQNSTWSLFDDFALSKIIHLIKFEKIKRRYLLNIIYSFCASDASVHMNTIKSLQEKLNDTNIFVHCLSSLASMEQNWSSELVDIYVFYAHTGLNSPSPSLRASSLSILHSLLAHPKEASTKPTKRAIVEGGLDTVQEMIQSTLLPMLQESWWEIKAQLIILAAKLLLHLDESHPDSTQAYTIIETILRGNVTPHVYAIALSHLAPCLRTHPALLELYTEILLGLTEEERLAFLDPNHSETIQIGSSCVYDIVPIQKYWDSFSIAKSLVSIVEQDGIEQLTSSHFDLLEACISTGFAPHLTSDWLNLFNNFKNHLFNGMLDDQLCELASNVILKYMKYLGEDGLRSAMPIIITLTETMFSSKSQGYDDDQTGEDASVSQDVFAGFLISLYELGGSFKSQLEKLAANLVERREFQETPLADFLLHVQKQ